MALVATDAGRFCVDLFEGAIVQGDGSLWAHEIPIDGADAAALHAVVADHVLPQGYISQVEATEMCAHSGKRLCTLEEWTAACRGQPAHDYLYP
jgi:formylglycine-generating enzyme